MDFIGRLRDYLIFQMTLVVVSNHQGQWESLFIQTLIIPNTSIVKRELLLISFFGWALRCMKPITLNRANKFSSLKKVIKKGVDKINDGYSVIFFLRAQEYHQRKEYKHLLIVVVFCLSRVVILYSYMS